MRTAIIIAGGLALLGVFVLVAHARAGSAPAGIARAALWFLPIWLAVAAANMWMGVARAGYSVAEEAPIFALIFALPAVAAVFVWWKSPRAPRA
jgi:hypothetical protein